jgi:uncharacterized protein (DUF1919 family)
VPCDSNGSMASRDAYTTRPDRPMWKNRLSRLRETALYTMLPRSDKATNVKMLDTMPCHNHMRTKCNRE